MITFMPFPEIDLSIDSLDYRRLGKQRIETRMILEILFGKDSPWKYHPVIRMWTNRTNCLVDYGCYNCDRWKEEFNYKDNQRKLIASYYRRFNSHKNPNWMGNMEFHKSHQSNLLRKYPEHYSKYFVDVPIDLPYIWPNRKE